MKKRIALFLAALFAFSMVATSAFANSTDARATCQHTSGTKSFVVKGYSAYNNDYHYYTKVQQVVCNSCNEVVLEEVLEKWLEEHSHEDTGHYIGSSHSGKYTTHYYIYSGVCNDCLNEITWENHNVGCTEYNCVDPMCS